MEPGESSWVGGERSWNGIFTNLGNFTIGEHEFKRNTTFPKCGKCVMGLGEHSPNQRNVF